MTLKLTALLAAAGLALAASPVRAEDEKTDTSTSVEKKDKADGTTEKKVDKKVKHKKKGMKTSKKHVEDKTTTDANGNVVDHQHTEK
ncbi:hypothetical protein [Anaeromyxobacter paludicola]|uniref:Pentapeptide MXKDX repeat protein n=1 Tax=Anaeromyxobacter paludicola TaxID=2918171 RepID=A0ABM7XD31_9BACT|nr:hypothetical protein [Anaeromyxobacter paludicola]BDG09781.1 hypothetical protein AMPC_28940 [Anaeromyxobacter paludicola]